MSKKSKKRQQAQAAQANSSQTAGKPAPANSSPAPKSTPQNSATPSGSKAAQSQAKSGSSRTNKTAAPSSFFQRLLGVITLRAPVYRELAHDTNATVQAAIVVVVVALVVGAIAAYGANVQLLGAGGVPGVTGIPEQSKNPLARGIVMVIQELLIWGAGAFVIAAVAKNVFQGKTDTGEMLRVFGFTRVFQILLVLGVFSGTLAAAVSIAGLVLSIIGSIVGIREATGFTTGKAAIVGVFAITLVAIVISFFTAFVLNPFVTTLLPT